MRNAYVLTGTVSDERTLNLDEDLPVKAGKVRVVVELIQAPLPNDYPEFMARLREQQRQRGHVPRTREEVDAYLKAERDSWDR